MLAGKALNTDIQPLTAADSIGKALERMEELQVSCLPVVESTTKKLIGQLNNEELREAENRDSDISSIELDEPVKIFERQHIFEGARLMLQYEQRLLPVVNDEMILVGVLQKQQVLESLSHMLNLATYGSILTVELDQRDFMLSEIVNIIETEEAKILGVTVETPSEGQKRFKVSIKINLQDATRVAAALRRYGYVVSTDVVEQEVFGLDMESRADELIKYLDM